MPRRRLGDRLPGRTSSGRPTPAAPGPPPKDQFGESRGRCNIPGDEIPGQRRQNGVQDGGGRRNDGSAAEGRTARREQRSEKDGSGTVPTVFPVSNVVTVE